MKERSMKIKKIYKSMAYLFVATFAIASLSLAWFSIYGNAAIDNLNVVVSPGSEFSYMFYSADFDALDTNDDGIGTFAERQAASWGQVGNIDVSSMFPGKHYSYKVVATVNASLSFSFIMDNITGSSDALNAISIYTIAASGSSESVASVIPATEIITDLAEVSFNSSVFSTGEVSADSKLVIYFDVYMDGSVDNEALRTSGASVQIGNVSLAKVL